MGKRSMNYIVLHPDVKLTDEVSHYINNDQADFIFEDYGTLLIYESHFSPMHARKGISGVMDLEQEVAIQRFLGSLPTASFYMKRAGDEFDYRGAWSAHPFRDNERVKEIEAKFDEFISRDSDHQEHMILSLDKSDGKNVFFMSVPAGLSEEQVKALVPTLYVKDDDDLAILHDTLLKHGFSQAACVTIDMPS